ncbi:stefin-C-like [Pelodiscus sinensis]|uniref:stefin-C-like n=1 Tax=Pelodiscus sinensis TaxID=13735 RepID=UPI003F6CB32C
MSERDPPPTVGGFSDPEPANEEIRKIVEQVQPQLEEKVDVKYEYFEAIEFRTQIVAGTNYLIKVSVSNSTEECVHLKVFVSLPYEKKEPSLTAYQTGKTKRDPLTPF